MNHSQANTQPAVGSSPVEAVRFVRTLERPTGQRGESWSRPGHLIQLTTAGRCWHEVAGRRYLLEPGRLIWFHEVEPVRVEVREGPWRFYALNFIAPTLGPPAFDRRMQPVNAQTRRLFDRLHDAWQQTGVASPVRQRRVRGWLELLLAELVHGREAPFHVEPGAALWWTLEAQLREQLDRRFTLADLAALADRSPATVARACHAATGTPPLRRIKRIRLDLGRALVQQTDRGISEIAVDLGYARVHEFSRDYRERFGVAPTRDR